MIRGDTKRILQKALSLLSLRDRLRIYAIAIIQPLIALFDLFGIALIGLVASLSLFGIQSKSLPENIESVIGFLGLDELSLQIQVAILGLVAGLFLIVKTMLSAIINQKILFFLNIKTAVITVELLNSVLEQPFDYVKTKSPAELLFSLTKGVRSLVVGIIGAASLILSEIVLLIVIFSGVFIFDPVITIFAVGYFGLIGLIQSKRLSSSAHLYQRASASALVKSEGQILESLSLYRELHVRNARIPKMENLIETRKMMAHTNSKVLFMPYIAKYTMEISLVVGSFLLMATQFLIKDALTAISTLSIFLAAATRVSPSLLRLQQGLIQFRSSSGEATQSIYLINELMDFKLEISKNQTVAISAEPKGEIHVDDLFFRYRDSDEDCINGISFTVAPGTILAIVGASGHGKSTLMDLMMGALVPKQGSVTIDGLSPRSFISNFAGAVGYVAQESVFTNASVRENLLLGLSADSFPDQLIWSVLSEVGLDKAIRALPGGLDGSIGEKGLKFSVGQRQRLSVARALITRPKVLFLDEPTSSLDPESENLITNLINSLHSKSTIVVIAHRLETIKSSDQIALVEEGRISKIGSYSHIFN